MGANSNLKNFARTKRLLARAKQNDNTAYSELLSLYFVHIYYVAYQMLDDKEKAVEATYETFEKAFAKLTSLNSPEAFPSWLRSISHNVCMDMLRRQQKETRTGATVTHDEAASDDLFEENLEFLPEEYLHHEEARSAITQLVRTLPPAQKEAVLLYYFDGLSSEEIAQITGSTPGAVHRSLSRARASLREMITTSEYAALKTDLTSQPAAKPARSTIAAKAGAFTGAPILGGIFAKDAQAVATPEIELLVKQQVFNSLGMKVPVASASKAALITRPLLAFVVGALAVSGMAAVVSQRPDPAQTPPSVAMAKCPATAIPAIETTPAVTPAPVVQEETATPVAQVAEEAPVAPQQQTKAQTSKTVAEKPAEQQVDPAVPSIVMAKASITYAVGSVITLDGITRDADVFAVDARGNSVAVYSNDWTRVDVSRVGTYYVSFNAKDSQGHSAKTVVLTVEIARE